MIVSGGEALVDIVPGDAPDDPPRAVPGGGPMNAAIAAARLGAPAAFAGRVSTDDYGVQIWDHLESNDVDLRLCERGDEPTARAIVEHVPQLQFRFEGVDTADTMLESVDISTLGAGPHILHGGTLGMFRGRTAEVLASLAETHDGIVSLDPNVRPRIITDRDAWLSFHARWASVATVYRASNEDIDWIWPGRDEASCAEELIASGTTAFVVTKGGEGATFYTVNGVAQVEGRVIELVDTVGAGDTFVGAMLASLHDLGVGSEPGRVNDLSTDDWTTIGNRSVAASAITCTRRGANPPYLHELDI